MTPSLDFHRLAHYLFGLALFGLATAVTTSTGAARLRAEGETRWTARRITARSARRAQPPCALVGA